MPPKPKPAAGPSKKTETKKKEKVIEVNPHRNHVASLLNMFTLFIYFLRIKRSGWRTRKGPNSKSSSSRWRNRWKLGDCTRWKRTRKSSRRRRNWRSRRNWPHYLRLCKRRRLRRVRVRSRKNRILLSLMINFSGADPKSIVCSFFKQGQCGKGDRCKFSHDLTIERKAEKRSLYVDMRDDEDDTMENWDEQKLLEVVEKKHGMAAKMPTTDIVSLFLIFFYVGSIAVRLSGVV